MSKIGKTPIIIKDGITANISGNIVNVTGPKGNYTLGIEEYTVFPEIDTGKVERVQGIEITIATTASERKGGFELLKALGMPFQK